MQNLNFDQDLEPFKKIDSEWILDPNVNSKSVKLLKENIGENLCDFGSGDECLDPAPKA